MSFIGKFQYVLLVGMSLVLFACGSINSEPDAIAEDPTTQSSKVTKNNQFYVYFAAVNGAPPAFGDNPYVLRFVRTKDLLASSTAKVTFTYLMPQMPEMGQTDSVGQRQADGSYTVSIFYSMGGRWQVTMKIEDGISADEYVFEVAL